MVEYVHVDVFDLTDETDLSRLRDRPDLEHRPVFAREADRRLTLTVEALDDVGVDLAQEDHLCHLDCGRVGDPQAIDELDLESEPLHVFADPGPPPWTITGFKPTYLSRTTSRANPSRADESRIAAPPYLITTVRPWNSRM